MLGLQLDTCFGPAYPCARFKSVPRSMSSTTVLRQFAQRFGATNFGWASTTIRCASWRSRQRVAAAASKSEAETNSESTITSGPTRVSAASRKSRKSVVDKSVIQDNNKAKALETVINDINAKFGKGSLMQLGQTEHYRVDTIPSGALTLDVALGGGFPKGRIIEVYGPESSGKTTLALHAIASVQQRGGIAALVDAEHAFDEFYARKTGIKTEELLLCQPDCGEMGLEVVDQLIRSSAVDIIVVDSVAALTPRAEIEGEIGMLQVGAQARLMSQALRKLVGSCSKCNCTVIFLNQLRHKVGVLFGSPETTSGGQALKFYSSVRVDVRRKATIKAPRQEVESGIRVRAKVVKNKCAAPYRLAEFDIMFNTGICTMGCMLDAADNLGVVTKKGAFYYFMDQRLGQGRDNVVKYLKESPEIASQIDAQARQAMESANTNDWYADKSTFEEEDEDDEEDDATDDELMPGAAAMAANLGGTNPTVM